MFFFGAAVERGRRGGAVAELTDEHPASTYGLPVLVIDSGAVGPADLIGRLEYPAGAKTATAIVQLWAMRFIRSREEHAMARAFLQSWPEGPQFRGD